MGEGKEILYSPDLITQTTSLAMSKRLAEPVFTFEEEDNTEKKQRPTVCAPKVFHSNEIQKATVKFGRQYRTQFIRPAVFGANNIEFLTAKNPWGPDLLVVVYPKERLTLRVHRKTADAKEYRVVYRRSEGDIEMTATETDDSFVVKGPDFELEIKEKRQSKPQLAAIAKERELMAKVLLIRKEYEETVLPHLPVSIQFTGAMVLGSLLPSVTVELRKGQLEDAEKQLV